MADPRPIMRVEVMFDLDNDHMVVTDRTTDEVMLDLHGDLDPFVEAFLSFSTLCEHIAVVLEVVKQLQGEVVRERPNPRNN